MPKWSPHGRIILAKGQFDQPYTFWTMANYNTVDCLCFFLTQTLGSSIRLNLIFSILTCTRTNNMLIKKTGVIMVWIGCLSFIMQGNGIIWHWKACPCAFIQILSWFYPDFIQNLIRIMIKSKKLVHCKYIRPDYDGTLAIHSSTI